MAQVFRRAAAVLAPLSPSALAAAPAGESGGRGRVLAGFVAAAAVAVGAALRPVVRRSRPLTWSAAADQVRGRVP
ncbi:hypothetical protein OG985_32860 [Streptomyces sp. NBC_00289]|uniref:hypothetical protein n=1 Tax=Streptomyces sp. NBC_00289 TaxID=2975703 RepID=UPI0032559F3E